MLVEPDRVLDTGIDIVAQPPGKKLQNLQLLSGGERALTAIALLFAILQVKPVPFCVLDEVEAALDEANVSRFAQYLREFSESDSVYRRYTPQRHDGGGRCAVRGNDGGRRRIEAGIGTSGGRGRPASA